MKSQFTLGKRALSWLLAFVVIFSLLPATSLAAASAPDEITVALLSGGTEIDGTLYARGNDTFQLVAYDENGKETPVTWSTTSTTIQLDSETGAFTYTGTLAYGNTAYLYFVATSTLDSSVTSASTKFTLKGWCPTDANLNKTIALSNNGQTAKSVTLSGGISGLNLWSYDQEALNQVGALSSEPGNGTSISFSLYRPGTFTVTFAVDGHEDLTATTTVTVTGVAVEDELGNREKVYLSLEDKECRLQLVAYCEEDCTVSTWSSSNENIATVDENGVVTGVGVGSAYIYATDSNGTTGGIKVVVTTEQAAYFENIDFSSLSGWTTGSTFSATTLEYTGLKISSYSTSKLTLAATTLYDTEAYSAYAHYTDSNGEDVTVFVNSGATTGLSDIPFGTNAITITITSLTDPSLTTDYVFTVTRPRDTTQYLASTSGIVITPEGRELSTVSLYQGKTEGTFFRASSAGVATTTTGVANTTYYYRAYLLDNTKSFTLTLKTSTTYAHLRYSTDQGNTWTELGQYQNTTDLISLGDENEMALWIQVISDSQYYTNLENGLDGFGSGSPNTYILWVEAVDLYSADCAITEATLDIGDFYPGFSSTCGTFIVSVPNGTTTATLSYQVSENTTVTLNGTTQVCDETGTYTLTLSSTAKTLTLTNTAGLSATVSFTLSQRGSATPDAVVDYLCIGSQYTNVSYGLGPESTLAASYSLKSLGGFGGYITYYYEDAIYDDPCNLYGVDFYIYGNSFLSSGTVDSGAEPGQVWVSEDGITWYALAGSEYYEETSITDYEITYTKTSGSTTAWSDNYGNSGTLTYSWPKVSNYSLCPFLTLGTTSITLKGILLCAMDGSFFGDGTTAAYAGSTSFGYVDYFPNGTLGEDVNPYSEEGFSNGFDLAWAVDENGDPVTFENGIHYIKVVTANHNIAGAFGEKSTEISTVLRTTAQSTDCSTTTAPTAILFTNGSQTSTLTLSRDTQVYEMHLMDLEYFSVGVVGAAETANIYVNNQRITAAELATGFHITEDSLKTTLRIIVQEDDASPLVYIIHLTGEATETSLVSSLSVMAGSLSEAATTDGSTYSVTLEEAAEEISIIPVLVDPDAVYTVNGDSPAETYSLSTGENSFTISVTLEDVTQEITLIVTCPAAEEKSTDTITVTFLLYGDTDHDAETVHTYANDKDQLPVWIAATEYTVSATATVKDVLELALTEAGFTWENAGGNYISSIQGLAEYSNGSNSGWMYLLNGTYASLGIAEQTLTDGDVILFHYTDDYSLENYSGKEEGEEKGAPSTTTDWETIYEAAALYLLATVTEPTVSSIGGEWVVLGLSRSSFAVSEDFYAIYCSNLLALLEEQNGILSNTKYTEYSRVILALTAAGYDVTDVGSLNFLSYLTDYNKVVAQGINGAIFALLALDSYGYAIPDSTDAEVLATREAFLTYILEQELSEGGWSLGTDTADVDITAMVLQALAPYYQTSEAITAAVDRGLLVLSALQEADGGFSGMGSSNCESCAQVLVALTALGIDPLTEEAFLKNGYSLLDALCSYALEDGSFSHLYGQESNAMATEQAFYALVAYSRFLSGENALYNMTDVTITRNVAEDAATAPVLGDTTGFLLYGLLMALGILLMGISVYFRTFFRGKKRASGSYLDEA